MTSSADLGPSDRVGGPDDGDSTTDRGGPGPSGTGTGTPSLDEPTDAAPPPPPPPPPPADPADAEPPPPPPPPEPVESEPAVTATPEPSRPATPWKLIAGLAVLAVALGIAAFLIGKVTDEGDDTADKTSSTTTPANFVTVRDKEGGFTIKHPKSWKSVRDPEGDERLFLTAGGQNYLRVRVVAVDPSIDLKAGIETGFQEEGVRVIKKQDLTLNGVPGFYYLYTFDDPSTQEQAVHAHYFLVRGEKMYVIVFQALPPDEFTRLAPVFDQVAETFQSTSDAPAPTPTSTPDSSTPDSTTAPATSSTTKP